MTGEEGRPPRLDSATSNSSRTGVLVAIGSGSGFPPLTSRMARWPHGQHAQATLLGAAGRRAFARLEIRRTTVPKFHEWQEWWSTRRPSPGHRAIERQTALAHYIGKVHASAVGPTHAVTTPSSAQTAHLVQADCAPQNGTQSASFVQEKQLPPGAEQ
jgi:hypothetical protein